MPSLTPQYQSRCVRLFTALLLLCPVPICLYGGRAALLLVIGLVCAFLCDLIFRPLFGLERKKRDLSSYITALLITLLLPVSISWYGVICGVVTGLLIGKYLFGGTGRNIFNPAALGVAVVSLAFGSNALSYPAVGAESGAGTGAGHLFHHLRHLSCFGADGRGDPQCQLHRSAAGQLFRRYGSNLYRRFVGDWRGSLRAENHSLADHCGRSRGRGGVCRVVSPGARRDFALHDL